MPAYSTDRGFTGTTKDKPTGSGKPSAGGSAKGLQSSVTQPRDPAGPSGAISGGSGVGPGGKSYTRPGEASNPGRPKVGGTTVTYSYSPGAVPNYPSPSAGQVASFLTGGPLGPLGAALTLGYVADADQYGRSLLGRKIDASFSSDPSLQDGWQPDRDRNKFGGARNEGMSQTISGAGVHALARSQADDYENAAAPAATNNFSDLQLKDRRKPYPALKQMLEAML